MSKPLIYLCILLLLFFLELLYFRIADRLNIIDEPNDRSSHTKTTIRGGGIIFSLAAFLWFAYSDFSYPYFITGLILIAAISFIDDVTTLKSSIRSVVHLLAVSLLLYQLNLNLTWFWFPLIMILVIGTINAYNFMDGINGITGGYSLVVLATLFFVNRYILMFTSETLMVSSLLSLLVFNFFNFRKKAKCFAGDVGSVSIAFIICFILIQLIAQTGNLLFLALLLIYGLDAVTTIIFRLIRKENIFEAHRSHFYQYLANERGLPHLGVSIMYAVLQSLINIAVIYACPLGSDFFESLWILLAGIVFSGLVFVGIRLALEGKKRLFGVG
ncbi:MAG TPA: glycosyltransferase family 4 protein [Pedobacter sp.]